MGICETEQGSIVEPLGKMAEEQDENVEAPSKEELQDAAEEEFANVSRPPRIPFRSGSSYPPPGDAGYGGRGHTGVCVEVWLRGPESMGPARARPWPSFTSTPRPRALPHETRTLPPSFATLPAYSFVSTRPAPTP